jgi:filamentous hemagglutinin family protein
MKSPFLITILLLIITLSLQAEIITDGSLGHQLNLQGPNYQIKADLGRQYGGNLFHSFQEFNLQNFESATFSSHNPVNHVITRVTGGQPSQIDGLIRSTIPQADLYFLNPDGIMFGPQARLDIQGSFHASTADYLLFKEGGRFDARHPTQTLLTVAPIEAFGFFSDAPSQINIQDSQLSVSSGQTLSLIGGDLQINGTNAFRHEKTRFPISDDAALLSAPGGRINLVSLASQNTVTLNNNDLTLSVNEQGGSLQATNGIFDVTGKGGGNLFIRAGNATLTNTQIDSQTLDSEKGGLIDIQVANLHLNDGSEIFTRTYGTGKATAVHIQATDTIQFSGMNQKKRASTLDVRTLQKSAEGGDASEILITGRNISFLDGAHIYSDTQGGGNGAQVTLKAEESVRFSGVDSSGWRIAGFTMDALGKDEGAGHAGNLLIEAKDITFENGAGMQSGTAGKGDSANATIRASGTFTLTGLHKDKTGSQLHTGVMGKSSGGEGGDLLIEVGNLLMDDGARIYASTNGPGHGGNITLHATGSVTLLGNNDQGQVSRIVSESKGGKGAISVGNGGRIHLTAKALTLRGGAQISTSAKAYDEKFAGQAGEIQISVDEQILLTGFNPEGEERTDSGSGIYAFSIGIADNSDDAGDIVLKANALTIQDGGLIRSSTDNYAQGGNIKIEVEEEVKIVGHSSSLHPLQMISGIYATSENIDSEAGLGGNIVLNADRLVITEKGKIVTATAGGGKAGNITVNVNQLEMDDSASMSSESQLSNTYQYALSHLEQGLVILGDIVEIAQDEDGKISRYANVGNRLLRIQPIYTVPLFSDLFALSKQYNLQEGDVIDVTDLGNGESARFLYSYNNSYHQEAWIKLTAGPISVNFETLDDIYIIDKWFKPDEIPYPSGTLIEVKETGNGRPAFFVYSADIVIPVNGKIEGTPIRIKSFELSHQAQLNQLAKMALNGDIVKLNDQRFVFINEKWVALTDQIHQVAQLPDTEQLVQAQIGNIAQLADVGNGQPGEFIYTGSGWTRLNRTHEKVNTLAELSHFPAKTGDLVEVEEAGTGRYEHFFYVDDQWLKQVKGGDAGTITISSRGPVHLSDESIITTGANSGGGGEIHIETDTLVFLEESQITTSVQEGRGNGGNLTLEGAEFVILNHGNIIAQANQGQGGDIHIQSDQFIETPESLVSASSKLGIDGEVNIDSPDVDMNHFMMILPDTFVEAQLKQCDQEEFNNPSQFKIDLTQKKSLPF